MPRFFAFEASDGSPLYVDPAAIQHLRDVPLADRTVVVEPEVWLNLVGGDVLTVAGTLEGVLAVLEGRE